MLHMLLLLSDSLLDPFWFPNTSSLETVAHVPRRARSLFLLHVSLWMWKKCDSMSVESFFIRVTFEKNWGLAGVNLATPVKTLKANDGKLKFCCWNIGRLVDGNNYIQYFSERSEWTWALEQHFESIQPLDPSLSSHIHPSFFNKSCLLNNYWLRNGNKLVQTGVGSLRHDPVFSPNSGKTFVPKRNMSYFFHRLKMNVYSVKRFR